MGITLTEFYKEGWIAGILATLVLILAITIAIEKRLKNKILTLKETNFKEFNERYEELIISNESTVKRMEKLDKIAKALFVNLYKIPGNIDYPELAQFFKEKNNFAASNFCQRMAKFRYTKIAISKDDIKSLILEIKNLPLQGKIEQQKERVEIQPIEKEHIMDILEKEDNYFNKSEYDNKEKKQEKDKHDNPQISSIDDLERIKKKIIKIKEEMQKSRHS